MGSCSQKLSCRKLLFYIVLITAIPNGTATTSMIGVKYFSGLLFYKKEKILFTKKKTIE